MASLTFAQSTRRNYAIPIILAALAVGVAGSLAYLHFAKQTIRATVTGAAVFPIQVTYKAAPNKGFKLLNQSETRDEGIYVIPNLTIDNQLTEPLFLKDFTATVTTPAGEVHTAAPSNRATSISSTTPSPP